MACRIQNLSPHRLALDLRGGEVLHLDPGQVSRPLREEALYGNIYLPQWQSRGLVRWLKASMADVLAIENPAAGGEPAVEEDASAKYSGGKKAARKKSESAEKEPEA